MTTTVFPSERIATSVPPKVLTLPDLAGMILDEALAQARQKLSPFQRDADLETLLNLPAFFDALKHGLAIGVAGALVENDRFVQAVYTYDPSANPDSESGEELPMTATVHLLVRVAKSSAALEAFIATLDHALATRLRTLPSKRFAQRESVLDVNLLTEEDVRLGTGYGALLSSLFAPPLKVWARD